MTPIMSPVPYINNYRYDITIIDIYDFTKDNDINVNNFDIYDVYVINMDTNEMAIIM